MLFVVLYLRTLNVIVVVFYCVISYFFNVVVNFIFMDLCLIGV